MADDLTKRAADMLLRGGTLVSEPCPYCRGVRIIKDGDALCTSCGRATEKRDFQSATASARDALEGRLDALSAELATETDHARQREIVKSIDLLAKAIAKLKNAQ